MKENHNGDRNGDALFEDKFARVFSEIRRLDQLRTADLEATKALDAERTLRLDQRMNGQETAVAAALAAAEKAVTAALSASDKAVSKAEQAQAKVNETQNEFRGTLRDQATAFMPRSETENLVRELRGLITQNANELGGLRSRVDIGPPTLTQLQTRSDEAAGHKAGSLDARTLAFALLGAFGLIIGVVATVIALARGG